MGLPIEWFDVWRPMPGFISVERDPVDDLYGGIIIIPDGPQMGTKAPEGTVRRIGDGVKMKGPSGDLTSPGDRVVLSAGVTKRISFGDDDERILYFARPEQIHLLIVEQRHIRAESSTYRPYTSEATDSTDEGKRDPGDELRPKEE